MGKKYKTCPACGAHLDTGERCDCAEATPAAEERAQDRPARITPPERAYCYAVGVDLANGPDFTAAARGPAETR